MDRGIIRVLDALFVRKDEDGTFSGFDLADVDEDTAGDLTCSRARRRACSTTTTSRWRPRRSSPAAAAVMIVYENRWAAPFVASVRRNGGEVIASQRIGVQELIDALDAAEAAT